MAISAQAGGFGARARKAVAWRRRMLQWQRSGLSQSAFCRRHGLAIATFQYWRKRAGQGVEAVTRRALAATSRPLNGAAFIPVRVKARSAASVAPLALESWACEVVGPGGVSVRLRERPSLGRLRKMVALWAGAPR